MLSVSLTPSLPAPWRNGRTSHLHVHLLLTVKDVIQGCPSSSLISSRGSRGRHILIRGTAVGGGGKEKVQRGESVKGKGPLRVNQGNQIEGEKRGRGREHSCYYYLGKRRKEAQSMKRMNE